MDKLRAARVLQLATGRDLSFAGAHSASRAESKEKRKRKRVNSLLNSRDCFEKSGNDLVKRRASDSLRGMILRPFDRRSELQTGCTPPSNPPRNLVFLAASILIRRPCFRVTPSKPAPRRRSSGAQLIFSSLTPNPGLLKILKRPPSQPGSLSGSSFRFVFQPRARARGCGKSRESSGAAERLICKRIFALINGFKALGPSRRRVGGRFGRIQTSTPTTREGGTTTRERESFEFILITLTNADLEKALTNYLPEYDCVEFLTKDRPSLSHNPKLSLPDAHPSSTMTASDSRIRSEMLRLLFFFFFFQLSRTSAWISRFSQFLSAGVVHPVYAIFMLVS